MIITRTHSKESLKDFKKDYPEDIRPRCFGFVKSNRKLILRSQKLKEQKTKKESWVLCKGVRKIKTSRGNHYRVIVRARFNKKGEPGIMTTVYLVLNDSLTGQKIVYLMPADEGDKGIISFSSKFFTEFNDKLGMECESFEESVDNFMKQDKSFTLYEVDTNNPRYNCQVDFGNGWAGFGSLYKETGIFKIRHFYTLQDLENEAKSRGIKETNPIKVYIALRWGIKEDDEEEQPKTDKQREIEEAWKEYYEQQYS